jgi:hypothetical protein
MNQQKDYKRTMAFAKCKNMIAAGIEPAIFSGKLCKRDALTALPRDHTSKFSLNENYLPSLQLLKRSACSSMLILDHSGNPEAAKSLVKESKVKYLLIKATV